MKFSVCAVMVWMLASGWSVAVARSPTSARPVPVNIFGGGNPLNGIDDDGESVVAISAEDG